MKTGMAESNHNRRLKIAMLVRHYNPSGGGAERYCIELTEQLALQHEVHLFAQTISGHSENITPHLIPQWLERPRYINQLLFSWLTHKATQGKFDIVHSHDMVTHANIYTLHVPCVRTRLTEAQGIRKILHWLNTLLSPRKLAYLWLEKTQMQSRPDKQLIAVSDFLSRNVAMNYPETKGAITIAYPGIHPAITQPNKVPFWRKDLSIPEEAFLLLSVANDFNKKGVQTIIDALAQLNQPLIHLAIAGNGKIESLQIPESLDSNLHFLGIVDNISAVYVQADSLVHPTRIDTYGMVVLEAMAHRLAVIVSNQNYCGFSEHLNKQEVMLLEYPENASEIAEKIDFLFNHPKERNKMVQLGWEKSQTITWEQTTSSTLHAYQLALPPRVPL